MLDEKNWWSAAYRGRDKVRGVLVRGLLNSWSKKEGLDLRNVGSGNAPYLFYVHPCQALLVGSQGILGDIGALKLVWMKESRL